MLLTYDEALAAGRAAVGGKAWNVARLSRYGFAVPRGGVLPADVYRLAHAGDAPDLAHGGDTPDLARAAHTPDLARAAHTPDLARAAHTPDLARAVGAFLARAHLEDVPLAVRSSATAEDSPSTSFAGIHDSVLDVRGLDAVLQAINHCYASLATPRARAYRQRFGLSDDAVACAVLVCEMVPQPVAAGVAFSCDPRTGRRDRLAISATAGRPEAVVQGTATPEEITISTSPTPLTIVERRGPRVLAPSDALRLARMILRIEWALGDGQTPQDVEWLFDGRTFWVVQARPVTALPRVTLPLVAKLPVTWSNGNVREVIAGVPTTSTWSLIAPFLRQILLSVVTEVGYRVPPGMEVVRRFDGRVYLDLTSMQAVFFDAIGTPPEETSRHLGGPPAAIPVPPGDPLRLPRRQWTRSRLLALVLGRQRRYARTIARERTRAQARGRVDLRRLSNQELLAFALEPTREQIAFGTLFQLGNLASGLSQQLLEELLERARPGEGGRLAAALMAGGGGVVTAEHGYALYDLAAIAAGDPAARAALDTPHAWSSLPESSPFRRALERFLEDYGHRGIDELELASPRWREDPSYVLDQVRVLVDTRGYAGASPRALARERRQRAEAELRTLRFATRWMARGLAALSRHTAAQREAGKSALVAMFEPTRGLVLELGRRLEVDAVYLAWWDIEAYLRGEWDGRGASELVSDRRRQRDEQLSRPAPPGLITEGAGVTPQRQVHSEGAASRAVRNANQLRGVAVSPGRVSGPARVLLRPQDGARLRAGEVLVAPATDPAWTPLFLRAAAVAAEVGGYLSHTAIVAREYGLPAVVNIPDLLASVRDGQPLTVDGNTGRVELG